MDQVIKKKRLDSSRWCHQGNVCGKNALRRPMPPVGWEAEHLALSSLVADGTVASLLLETDADKNAR